jgi:hypothetical protein
MTTFLNHEDDQDGDDVRDRRERFETPREKPKRTHQAHGYARRGKSPAIFNGIHRRRNKRVTW